MLAHVPRAVAVSACGEIRQAHSPASAVAHPTTLCGTSRPALASGPRAAPALSSAARATLCRAAQVASDVSTSERSAPGSEPLRVLIAGAGIGGLVVAVGLLKKGFKVQLLERDLTSIRGEGKYRGPIQLQSNALAALEALDAGVADAIMREGCITGDRINGLCDGLTGDWYVKFDTFHPAADRGLPVTRVVSRMSLQEILADTVRSLGGDDIIMNDVRVVDYENSTDPATGRPVVHAILEDGTRHTGDLLIGADGIWSRVRRKMVGEIEANYSQYTCYTGISDFTPPDIDTVGYRVFLGNGRYFVSSDVGGGKMQWYGFHREPAGGTDPDGRRKERLMEIFGDWSDMVTDLILATPEEDVLRRDIYDRAPIFKWVDGRVALLGDSAHAMQPNLGQGGGMAIEDGFQLVTDLGAEAEAAAREGRYPEVESVLQGYFRKRLVRASAVHGMAGMAAYMASTYKAYLGEGLGPLEWITRFKIPHPGRVGGQVVMNLTMPSVLEWVLGGYKSALDRSGARATACRVGDQPQGFDEADFPLFMRDNDALLRAANAEWMLQPLAAAEAAAAARGGDVHAGAVAIGDDGLVVGSAQGSGVHVEAPGVAPSHAKLERIGQDYFVTDLGGEGGTYREGRRLEANRPVRVLPGDLLSFGAPGEEGAPAPATFKVKLRHVSLASGAHGVYDRRSAVRAAPSGERHMALSQ